MASHISIAIIDNEGGRKTMPIYFNNGLTVANAQSFVTAFVPLLAAVITGGIVGAEVCVGLTVPAGSATPQNGSRVDAGGRISYRNTAERAWGMYIPTMNVDFMNQGIIDLAQTPIENLNAAITAGLGGVVPTDPNELDLDWVIGGEQAIRKR